MGEEGDLVHRLHAPGGGGQGVGGIALLAGHSPWLLGGGLEHRGDAGARQPGVGPLVPLDHERVTAELGRPVGVRDHGNARADWDDVADAGHGLGPAGVEGLRLTAEDRAADDGGDQHSRHRDVDAVDGRAVHLRWVLEPLDPLADELEVLGILELRVGGHRDPRGRVCELAVCEPAARRRM